jgi:hypothetical protein
MGEIITFVLRPAKTRSALQVAEAATIVFFPGVRVEHFKTVDERLATEPLKRKRARTGKRKIKSVPAKIAETQESIAQ